MNEQQASSGDAGDGKQKETPVPSLPELFGTSEPKAFAKLFQSYEPLWGEPSAFFSQVAEEMPLQLYERYYGDLVPHAFFGVCCAAATLGNFPQNRIWWPCVQEAWFLANERRRRPWQNAPSEPDTQGDLESRLDRFGQALSEGAFEACYALMEGLLASQQERDAFRTFSSNLCISDTAHGGLKFIHWSLAWKMSETLEHKHLPKLLFPALHFLVNGPVDSSISERVSGRALPSISGSKESVSAADQESFEGEVLYADDPAAAVGAFTRLAGKGYSESALHEALLLAASQTLINAQIGRWLRPIRALLYTDLLAGRDQPAKNLLMSVLLIQKASMASRESLEPRRIVDLANAVCPADPFNTLRSLVSHSDPYASSNTVKAILGMGEGSLEELFQTLATLAAKNDGRIGQGYDLLLVDSSARAYRRSNSELKDRFLTGCGFFLGRILKNYDLFGAYGVS